MRAELFYFLAWVCFLVGIILVAVERTWLFPSLEGWLLSGLALWVMAGWFPPLWNRRPRRNPPA